MKIILPVNYPVITSYQHHAAYLSILSENVEYLPWFYTNYIQIYAHKLDEPSSLNFYVKSDAVSLCPWLSVEQLNRSQLKTSIQQFIIDSLEEGYYVIATIDQFYIQQYAGYKKNHNPHRILIYGFDHDSQIFYTADFFKDGIFSFSKTNIIQLIDAYQAFDFTPDTWQNKASINIMRIRFNSQSIYQFDTKKVKSILEDYLNERVSPQNKLTDESRHHFFGIGVYKRLQCDLKFLLAQKKQDRRSFPVLADHKKVILNLIEFLGRNNKLISWNVLYNKYSAILSDSLVIRNLLLKFYVKGEEQLIFNALSRLNFMSEQEREIIDEIILKII